MKPNKPDSENRELFKRLLLVLITAVATVTVITVLHSHSFQRMFMTTQERIEDTSSTKYAPVKEDSIQLTKEKVPVSTFESDYSAESWYNKYKENPIAFNDQYDKKQIDVHGTITDISISISGYAIVTIGREGNVAVSIICNNVRNDKDMWREEVKPLKVGNDVHIRGFYWKSELDGNNLHLEKCHIIE